jgi:Holliday junction resolvase RusA-like endonuclease
MTRQKLLELTLPGRPVPWARARKSKWGGFFTPLRQAAHRETLANLIALKMREQGIEQFTGPVGLYAEFDYAKPETRIQVFELHPHGYKATRCDLDNLIKELAEACQDSGLVKDDAQIALVEAKKLK